MARYIISKGGEIIMGTSSDKPKIETPSESQLQSLMRTILSAITDNVEELMVTTGRIDIFTIFGVFEFKNIVEDETDHQAVEQATRYAGTDYVYSFGFVRDEQGKVIGVQGRIPTDIWNEMVKLGVVDETNCEVVNENEEGYVVVNVQMSTLDKFARTLASAAKEMHVHTFNDIFLRPFYDTDAYMSSQLQIDRKIFELQQKFGIEEKDIEISAIITNLFDINLTKQQAKDLQHLLRNAWRTIETAASKEELLSAFKDLAEQLRNKYGYEFNINWEDEYEILTKGMYMISALATHSGVVIGLNASTNRNVKVNNVNTNKHNLIELDFYSIYFNSMASISKNTIEAVSVGSTVESADAMQRVNLPKAIKSFLIENGYLKTEKKIDDIITFNDIKDDKLRKELGETSLAILTAIFRIGDPARAVSAQSGKNYFIEIEMTKDGKFVIDSVKTGKNDTKLQEHVGKPLSLQEILTLFDEVYKDENIEGQQTKELMLQAIGMVTNMIAVRDKDVLQKLGEAFLEHKAHAVLFFYHKEASKRLTKNLLKNLPMEYEEVFGKFNVDKDQVAKLVKLLNEKEANTNRSNKKNNKLSKEEEAQVVKDVISYLQGNTDITLPDNKQYQYVFMSTVLTILNNQVIAHHLTQGVDGVTAIRQLYSQYLIPTIVHSAGKKRRVYKSIAKTVERIKEISTLLNSSESSFLTVLEPTVDELRELMKMEKIDGLKDLWKYLLTDKSLPFYRKGDKNKFYFISGFAHAVSKHLLLAPNVDNNELEEWDKFFSWMLDELKSEYELDNDKYKKEITQAINSIYRAKQQIYAKQAILAAQKSSNDFLKYAQKQIDIVNTRVEGKKEPTEEINREANVYFQMVLLAQLSGDIEAMQKYKEKFDKIFDEYNIKLDKDTSTGLKKIIEKRNVRLESLDTILNDARKQEMLPMVYVVDVIIEKLEQRNEELEKKTNELEQKASVLERKEKWSRIVDDVEDLIFDDYALERTWSELTRGRGYFADIKDLKKRMKEDPELKAIMLYFTISNYEQNATVKELKPKEFQKLYKMLLLGTDGDVLIHQDENGNLVTDNMNKYVRISDCNPKTGDITIKITGEANEIYQKLLADKIRQSFEKNNVLDPNRLYTQVNDLKLKVKNLRVENNKLRQQLEEYRKRNYRLIEKINRYENNILIQTLASAYLTGNEQLIDLIRENYSEEGFAKLKEKAYNVLVNYADELGLDVTGLDIEEAAEVIVEELKASYNDFAAR